MPYNKIEVEQVASVTSSIAAGNAQRAVITEINGVPLEEFDEIRAVVDLTQYPTTAASFDVYFQRPVVVTPVAATDAHWDDLTGINFGAAGIVSAVLGGVQNAGEGIIADQKWSRTVYTISDATQRPGRVGTQLRLADKIGAGPVAAAIYTVTLFGYRKDV